VKKTELVQEKIINATLDLMKESGGDIELIQMRAIAKRAEVGIGLINYHFKTKEHLIELCVERYISNVISDFKPTTNKSSPLERLQMAIKMVFDFFMHHPEVARISILADMKNPHRGDNTMRSVEGMLHELMNSHNTDELAFESGRKMLAFTLVTVLQALFIRHEMNRDLFGCDFADKKERGIFLDEMVKRLYRGWE